MLAVQIATAVTVGFFVLRYWYVYKSEHTGRFRVVAVALAASFASASTFACGVDAWESAINAVAILIALIHDSINPPGAATDPWTGWLNNNRDWPETTMISCLLSSWFIYQRSDCQLVAGAVGGTVAGLLCVDAAVRTHLDATGAPRLLAQTRAGDMVKGV